MKAHTRLTDPQFKEMVRLYTDTDETVRSIAARFGVDPSYPTVAVRRLGLSQRDEAHSARMKARKAGRP